MALWVPILFFAPLWVIGVVIAVIDWKHLLIPDQLLGVLLLWAVGSNIALDYLSWGQFFAGGFLGTLLTGGIRLLGNWRYQQESMGLGDVKLCGVLGCFLGFAAFLEVLFMAALGGTLFGLINNKWRLSSHRTDAIPFGTFLVISANLNILLTTVL